MRVLLAVAIALMVTFGVMEPLCADDPLDAFPTADNSAADRIERLSDDELAKIDLPVDPKKVVFAFNMLSMDENSQRIDALPLLRVRADGNFDSGNDVERRLNVGSPEIRRSGMLSKAELQWLLHLAVNECDLLVKTTDGIEQEIQENSKSLAKKNHVKQLAAASKRRGVYVYEVASQAANNQVEIPEKALFLRSLRRKSGLDPVASLTNYAYFLTMRATLGDENQRGNLLAKLNEKLNAEIPGVPAFEIEHLRAASSSSGSGLSDKLDLLVLFEQRFEEPGGVVKRILGQIKRRTKGDAPEIVVWKI